MMGLVLSRRMRIILLVTLALGLLIFLPMRVALGLAGLERLGLAYGVAIRGEATFAVPGVPGTQSAVALATSAPDGELSGLFFFVDEFKLPGEYTEGENFIGVGDVFGDGELVFVPGDNFFPGDVFR